MRIFQRATQRGLGAAEQTSREGLRAAERATDQAGEVLSQTEEALREAELRTEVYGSLGTADYDGLAVEEAAKRLEGLSTDQLEKVREFEKNNKNRETLIERIDSRIRANF
jgi:predicted transcriptional regulator